MQNFSLYSHYDTGLYRLNKNAAMKSPGDIESYRDNPYHL
jgi:hypothetical protein